jgi:hypothetical protein
MLRTENSYRLGEEYQAQYKKSQNDEHKTKVTVDIQERVVTEFMEKANGIYKNMNEGLSSVSFWISLFLTPFLRLELLTSGCWKFWRQTSR